MTNKIRPLAEGIGAEIIGVDLSKSINKRQFEEINKAFLKYLVLLFREQKLMTVEQQISFSRRFGKLKIDLKAETTLAGHPEILVLSNIIKDGKYIGTRQRGEFWHADLYFEKIPSAAAILHAIIVPESGKVSQGDTLFANMVAAYEALPNTMKQRINGLKNRVSRVKSWPVNYPDLPPLNPEQIEAYSDVIHPLVRTHPVTGFKSLFFGDIAAGTIEGMPLEEGEALLSYLRDFATRSEFVYRHHWNSGDVLLWDNRATIHAATEFDEHKFIRHMHRTTIIDGVKPS